MNIIIRLRFHEKPNYETILAENLRIVKIIQNDNNQVSCNLLTTTKQIYSTQSKQESRSHIKLD